MPVYVLREGISNVFKIGRTSGTAEAVVKRLRTGNSQPLTLFEMVETDQESACEAFLHRRLRPKRIVRGGGWEFFEVDPIEMLELVREMRAMFRELQQAREAVSQFADQTSSESLLEPTRDDQELLNQILRNREEREFLAIECELLESKLKNRIGLAAGIRGVATWKTQVTRVYDEEVFRRSDPERYQEVLERFYCIDTKAWRERRPDEYKQIQTNYFRPRLSRALKLQKLA